MFHVKHRRRLALGAASLIGLLLLACGGGVGTRGWAAPQQAGGELLVSVKSGRLDGIDVTTRDRRWRFPDDWSIPGSRGDKLKGIYSQPAVSSDGKVVFLGDFNGHFYAFRQGDRKSADGKEPLAAVIDLGAPILGGLVLDGAGSIYVSAGSEVFKISTADMTRKIDETNETKVDVALARILKTGGDIWGTPLLSNGRLYVSSLDGKLYAINATTGEEAWRFDADRGLATSPVLAGNLILVAGFDNTLYALNTQDGSEAWRYKARNWVWTRPLVEGNRVYIGDFNGFFYAIDLSNGREVWNLQLAKSPIVAAPVFVNGTLVVAAEDGHLFGIDSGSQTQKWQANLGKTLRADLLARASTVYLAPTGCTTLPEQENKVYYMSVDPSSGQLTSSGAVC